MQSFTVSELVILGNSKKIGGRWYYPAAWTFKNSPAGILGGWGYILASLPVCGSHGGAIVGPCELSGRRRGRSWDVLIENAARKEA